MLRFGRGRLVLPSRVTWLVCPRATVLARCPHLSLHRVVLLLVWDPLRPVWIPWPTLLTLWMDVLSLVADLLRSRLVAPSVLTVRANSSARPPSILLSRVANLVTCLLRWRTLLSVVLCRWVSLRNRRCPCRPLLPWVRTLRRRWTRLDVSIGLLGVLGQETSLLVKRPPRRVSRLAKACPLHRVPTLTLWARSLALTLTTWSRTLVPLPLDVLTKWGKLSVSGLIKVPSSRRLSCCLAGLAMARSVPPFPCLIIILPESPIPRRVGVIVLLCRVVLGWKWLLFSVYVRVLSISAPFRPPPLFMRASLAGDGASVMVPTCPMPLVLKVTTPIDTWTFFSEWT